MYTQCVPNGNGFQQQQNSTTSETYIKTTEFDDDWVYI